MYTQILKDIEVGYKYTVIYLSTPPSSPIQSDVESLAYQPEFPNPAHLDLKRNLRITQDNSSSNVPDFRPLFEKYQFLTPGKLTRRDSCSSDQCRKRGDG